MYTLFGSKGSGSAAIEGVLEMAGEEFKIVDAATWDSGSAIADLKRVNPLQLIPTLVLPDGAVMTESAAIIIHLGLAHPAAGILPDEAAARAQAIRGLVFIAANCYAAVGIADYPERWCKPADDATAARVRAGARKRLHRYWDHFADQFPAQPFFSGAAPGGLDLLAAVVSKWSGTRAHVGKTRPDFLAAIERVERVPAIGRLFARHWDP